MATYLILNLVMLALIFAGTYLAKAFSFRWRIFLIMLTLTMIFDSLIIVSQIVGYDSMKILVIYIGFAPIEDFFYTLVAVMLVPALWITLGKKNEK